MVVIMMGRKRSRQPWRDEQVEFPVAQSVRERRARLQLHQIDDIRDEDLQFGQALAKD
jgi:hypothetical protein